MEKVLSKINVGRNYKIISFVLPLVLLGYFIYAYTKDAANKEFIQIIPIVIIALFSIYRILKLPTEIELYSDMIRMTNVLGQEKFIYVKDIKTIERTFLRNLIIRTNETKIQGFNKYSDLNEFVKEIKKINPQIISKNII